MKALSIRQPWAWLILSGFKDIENRPLAWSYTGPFAIHVGLQADPAFDVICLDVWNEFGIRIPPKNELYFGGIIGTARIDGRVKVPPGCLDPQTIYPSRWLSGPVGYVISDPKPLVRRFVRWKGQLGLFEVPDNLLAA